MVEYKSPEINYSALSETNNSDYQNRLNREKAKEEEDRRKLMDEIKYQIWKSK
jgi:hypothetical protein